MKPKNIFALSCLILFFCVNFSFAQKTQTATPVSNDVYNKNLFGALQWRCIGPWRGGRSLAVSGVVGDAMTYYDGQTGGGVWKSMDAGNTWFCISDSTFHSSSVGAVTVSKSNPNIVYVGMGEVEMRGNISFGDGVYKSTDAGKTWKHIGLEKSYAIGTIAINPTNPDIVYVAAMGKVFGANPERGLYRSKDGGQTWQLVLKKDDSTGCADVKMDPSNPLILYATMWQSHRTPWSLSSGGPGSGLYKTMDGGDTWTLISHNPGMPVGLDGKIICTISPANPQHLYAVVENENGGVFTSTDGGNSWSLVSTQHDLTQRPWYFSQIFADPKNENTVYIENVEFWKSIDGGNTWSKIENQHGDNHDMWINPDNPMNWIMGDDGGGEITFDGGKNFTEEDMPTCQFYHVNLDNDFPYHVYGAQQDNSSIRIASRTAESSIDKDAWFPVAGGESGFIVPDPNNSDITFGGGYDGQMDTYNKKTDQDRLISPYPEQHDGQGAIVEKYRFNWTYPISFSPWDNKTIYATSNHVHVSHDAGQTWKVISPDLTRNDPKTLQPSGGPISLDNTGAEVYGDIFAFAESPNKQGVLWAGSDDGMVHVSTDAGQNWSDVTPKELPAYSLVTFVRPSNYDAGTCFVCATAYKLDIWKPFLYRTTDYGKTWTAITTGLPQNMYSRSITEDPNKKGLLYCGTETGIYISFDNGDHWQSFQLNLPLTPVHDIQVQKRDKDLVIATHGRAFWILDDITPLYQLCDSIQHAKAWLYQPRDSYRTPGGQDTDPNLQAGVNAPNGVIVYYYFKNKPKKEVRLEFRDAKGDSVITYSSAKDNEGQPVKIDHSFYTDEKIKRPGVLGSDSGMNRFVWDLHYPDVKVDTGAQNTDGGGGAGPLTVPGMYTVKLFIGDSLVQKRNFNVIEDPRDNSSIADLQTQFDLAEKIHDKLLQTAKATKQIRSVTDQMNSYLSTFKDSVSAKPFKDAAKPILDSLDKISDELYNPKIKTSEDDLRYPVKLEEKLSTLNSAIEDGDVKPTASMYDVLSDLSIRIDSRLNRLSNVINNMIPLFNQMAAKHQADIIDTTKNPDL
jgi:photosystem II stability/assembly factor-like uncharacterized protein